MKRLLTITATLVMTLGLLVAPVAADGPPADPPPDAPPGHGPRVLIPPTAPPFDPPPAEPGAARRGPSMERLEAAGWHCYDPDDEGPLNIHCVPPGSPLHPDSPSAGHARASNALVFDAETGEFLGTTVMRSTDADLSHLPCPRGGGSWTLLDALWACHHAIGRPLAL